MQGGSCSFCMLLSFARRALQVSRGDFRPGCLLQQGRPRNALFEGLEVEAFSLCKLDRSAVVHPAMLYKFARASVRMINRSIHGLAYEMFATLAYCRVAPDVLVLVNWMWQF